MRGCMTAASGGRLPDFDDTAYEEARTSAVIRDLAARYDGQDAPVGAILDALKDRGFGALIILFALPNAVIPGLSLILGAPVLLFALQLAAGRREVWLPASMLRKTIPARLFRRIAARVESFALWVEKRSKPRWIWLFSGAFERVLGLYIAIVAAFLMTPVPLGNALPAIGISFMAAGLIERDGKAAAIGMLLGLLGALYIGAVIAIGFEGLRALLRLL